MLARGRPAVPEQPARAGARTRERAAQRRTRAGAHRGRASWSSHATLCSVTPGAAHLRPGASHLASRMRGCSRRVCGGEPNITCARRPRQDAARRAASSCTDEQGVPKKRRSVHVHERAAAACNPSRVGAGEQDVEVGRSADTPIAPYQGGRPHQDGSRKRARLDGHMASFLACQKT